MLRQRWGRGATFLESDTTPNSGIKGAAEGGLSPELAGLHLGVGN